VWFEGCRMCIGEGCRGGLTSLDDVSSDQLRCNGDVWARVGLIFPTKPWGISGSTLPRVKGTATHRHYRRETRGNASNTSSGNQQGIVID
jgi:hypothetical protein